MTELQPQPDREHELRKDPELPVVARMVIEVRSDGTRMMARGAMEDLETGQQVAIETGVISPLQMPLALSKTMANALKTIPLTGLAKDALKALVPERIKRRLRKKQD